MAKPIDASSLLFLVVPFSKERIDGGEKVAGFAVSVVARVMANCSGLKPGMMVGDVMVRMSAWLVWLYLQLPSFHGCYRGAGNCHWPIDCGTGWGSLMTKKEFCEA